MESARHRALRLAIASLIISPASAAADPPKPSVVKVETAEGGFRLLRDGKPFRIKGAGVVSSGMAGAAIRDLKTLKMAGGNAIRTWGTEGLGNTLDAAKSQDLAVCAGLWLGHPRHGFKYDDQKMIADQRAKALDDVRKFKDHPALLAWGLGNEMEGDGDDPLVWKEVEALAKLIHEADPNHPVMTVIAELGEKGKKVRAFEEFCPSVDVLGVNSYGGAGSLAKRLGEAGLKRPYAVTEFGPNGFWEVEKTPWGAPIEPTSARKSEIYLTSYRLADAQHTGRCLGSFAFLWGSKQEATSTWFGLLLPTGERLAGADSLTLGWTGNWPRNRSPLILKIDTPISNATVAPGLPFEAVAVAEDPDGDSLAFKWEVRDESRDRKSGGDAESAPDAHPEVIVSADRHRLSFRSPKIEGAYRLFVVALDGKGHAATANVAFQVKAGAK